MAYFLGALPYFIGDADYLGRPRRHGGGGYGGGYGSAMTHAAQGRANRAAGFVRPDIPGTPMRDAALMPMAFPPFAFALATGINSITQQANPQTPFRGQRLTSNVIRSGTSAAVTAPVATVLQVGQKPMLVTTGNGVPIETFSQNSIDTNLLFPPTIPGVVYLLVMNLTAALTTTDTVLALVSIIGSGLL
jgi:hypothetical protein